MNEFYDLRMNQKDSIVSESW